MGADYEGQEKAIAILRALPSEAKEYIAHHMRNALAGAAGYIHLAKKGELNEKTQEHLALADEGISHAVKDLSTFGC